MLSKNLRKMTLGILITVIGPVATASEYFSINDLSYKGASRIPVGSYGMSRMGFAMGTFVVDPRAQSLFVAGHVHHEAVAELRLSGFSKSDSIKDLPMAKRSGQEFIKLLDKAPTGNPGDVNRVTGLSLINGSLVLNGAKYYDGSGKNTNTTLIIKDPDDLAGSEITGYLKLAAKNHAAGWMTPIPASMQNEFDADYIFGFASNLPINSRNSMGPTAFAVRSKDLFSAEAGGIVPTEPLLDFSVANQLHPDHYNKQGGNDIWTEVSNAYVGFIVPGTDTYAVFGNSGGHEFGVGYKITQDTGRSCGGGCPYVSSDIYNYYWLWDKNDLLKVKNGKLQAHELRPYEYGEITLPFQHQTDIPRLISGAHYDSENGVLYFMLGFADTFQSNYENAPILLAYDVKVGERPKAPSNFLIE